MIPVCQMLMIPAVTHRSWTNIVYLYQLTYTRQSSIFWLLKVPNRKNTNGNCVGPIIIDSPPGTENRKCGHVYFSENLHVKGMGSTQQIHITAHHRGKTVVFNGYTFLSRGNKSLQIENKDKNFELDARFSSDFMRTSLGFHRYRTHA